MREERSMSNDFDAPVTYEAAAEEYDRASERFWAFVSNRTVARLDLSRGANVLDVPCGPGWSAIAASEAVGFEGRILAVDLAPRMLVLAREKARRRNLGNIEFLLGDMTRLAQPPESFDAVVCVLGLFFVGNMAGQIETLWRLVRPGGLLAISTLGRHFFSPVYDCWKTIVRTELGQTEIVGPWERTNRLPVVSELIRLGGVQDAKVVEEDNELPLPSPDIWWDIVMGTGMRKWVTDLGEDGARRVREKNLDWVREHRVQSLKLSAIYAVARKG
jgi:ubiquinone/menaquinone biosynthesis C-methylase UbiE